MSTRHEIYFAVGRYIDNNIPEITCCEQDIKNLSNAFNGVFFKYCGSPVQTIISTEKDPASASKIGMLRAFEKCLSAIQEEDTFVVTFSGHGASHEGESYWVPYDAVIGRYDTMIPFSWVKTILDRVKCKFRVVLIDACHSGDAKSLFKSTQTNLAFAESSTFVQSLINSSAGLAYGTACTFSEVAYVAPGGNSSVWIDTLVGFISDLRTDEPLFVDELLMRSAIATADRVKAHFNRTQTPFRVIKAAGVISLGFRH
jgi:uncharacterized caspase-like protein